MRAWEAHTTPPATIALIDELLDDHTYDQTVEILNERRLTGGWGKPFTVVSLTQLCRNRSIPSHHQRLRAAGMLTLDDEHQGRGPIIRHRRRLGLRRARQARIAYHRQTNPPTSA